MRRRDVRIEVLVEGAWVVCPDFGMLEPGDIFRQFTDDGREIWNHEGGKKWRAISPPKVECELLVD